MLFLFTLILGLCLVTTTTLGFQEQSVPAVQHENTPSVDRILDHMKVHDEWQERYLIEYRAQRNFHGANLRFEEEATLEVRTTFRRPDTIESQVLQGSRLIRERVFDNILKAENETHSKQAKQQVDIVPANYSFSYVGQELCGDRKCYRLGITPRRREKYLIQGQIWIDAEDWSIVRILGSPAKRPSFWTRETEIDRRYKRIDGMWLSDSLESTSDILIAGRSTLKIQYLYETIETDRSMEHLGEASVPCRD
jgi:hypothetical protein